MGNVCGLERKKVGDKEKGREMLPCYVQFHVVALPSGRGHILRNVVFVVEWKFTCNRLHSWDYLLILDKDEHIFDYTVYIMHGTSNSDVTMQL